MDRLRCGMMTVLLAFAALLAGPARAQAPEQLPSPHIAIELIAETDRPAPGGSVTLAFDSKPQPGWHGYWQNPGDAGLATKYSWTLPRGVTADAVAYPVPQRLLLAGIMNHVYEGPFAPLVTLRLPPDLKAGASLPIAVKLDYLVCTQEICVPEKRELALTLTVGDGAIPVENRTRFDQWRAALPKPLGADATFEAANGKVRLGIPFPAGAKLDDGWFFPITDGAISYSAKQKLVRDGDRLVIETEGKGGTAPIEGVLATGGGRGLSLRAMPGTVPPASGTASAANGEGGGKTGWSAALLAFGGAVLGGLLLNIMPCVFPILSLKALSLAKGKADGARPRAEALAYTAGVVLVCIALGGVLLGLRAAGSAVGWAFQLQDPHVILILLLLVTAIALNLAGLFELSTPGFLNRAAARGTGGAFATGALAAFIATPCTGPFMGAALGAALILPWYAALAIFAGLGLGIALPFLLLGFIPALRRMLPRPGAWMETFRRILSIPMFLTAIALAWVLGRQTGVDGMALGLLVLLGFAVVLWAAGRRQARGSGFGVVAGILLLLITVAGLWLMSRVPPPRAATTAASADGAEPFSEARLNALVAEGRPVFVYFTADWCLTCKVNEKAAIETETTRKAFAEHKVAVLVGDWTNGDATLGRFIEQHNRAGVPLYLWYAPGEPAPRVLPQILTPSMLAELAGGAGAGG